MPDRRFIPPFALYRSADPAFDPLGADGARLYGGRWNSVGVPVVYTAACYAGSLLEALVHAAGGGLPPRVEIAIDVPAGVRMETIPVEAISGWDAADLVASRAFGDRWATERRTAVLVVPAVVGRPHEWNALLNPRHADFARLTASPARPVAWDARLAPRAVRARR